MQPSSDSRGLTLARNFYVDLPDVEKKMSVLVDTMKSRD
jgi:hypothetical protein